MDKIDRRPSRDKLLEDLFFDLDDARKEAEEIRKTLLSAEEEIKEIVDQIRKLVLTE